MSKSREVEFDLSDFSLEEILEHLDSNSNELTKVQKNKLKEIIDDVEEDLTFRELCDDPMYQAATSVSSLNNVMKMEVIHPKENVYNWRFADSIVAFAKRNNMKVRGHTLIWYNQTPNWIFKDVQTGKQVS